MTVQQRRPWTAEERRLIRQEYPHKPTAEIARKLGRPVSQVYQAADRFGARKTQAYLNSPAACRLRRGDGVGKQFRFKPGHKTWNKGKKMAPDLYAKCAPTMFKPGRRPEDSHNYKPIGSLRITRDGQLERKVTDDPNLYPARRWIAVTRLVWEEHNGPIPRGHIVRFKDGMQTTEESEITIDRLECISKAENMRRNTVHNLPKPLAQVVQLRGALQRQINKRERREKQD